MEKTNPDAPQDLRTRTTDFALLIVKLYASLPKTTEAQVMGKQVLRSGTSIGAHYREGHRAKSDADIINKFETARNIYDHRHENKEKNWKNLVGGKGFDLFHHSTFIF